MPVFRRRGAGATDGTAQDSPGAQSPDGPADAKPARPAEAAKGRPTPKRSEAERAALKEAASRLQEALAAEGISEEEILRDFKRWRRGEHK